MFLLLQWCIKGSNGNLKFITSFFKIDVFTVWHYTKTIIQSNSLYLGTLQCPECYESSVTAMQFVISVAFSACKVNLTY